tara:strand:- start:1431 stop:2036 length:606 start_codon:yes stop_codon:yes gene_type:complete
LFNSRVFNPRVTLLIPPFRPIHAYRKADPFEESGGEEANVSLTNFSLYLIRIILKNFTGFIMYNKRVVKMILSLSFVDFNFFPQLEYFCHTCSQLTFHFHLSKATGVSDLTSSVTLFIDCTLQSGQKLLNLVKKSPALRDITVGHLSTSKSFFTLGQFCGHFDIAQRLGEKIYKILSLVVTFSLPSRVTFMHVPFRVPPIS